MLQVYVDFQIQHLLTGFEIPTGGIINQLLQQQRKSPSHQTKPKSKTEETVHTKAQGYLY